MKIRIQRIYTFAHSYGHVNFLISKVQYMGTGYHYKILLVSFCVLVAYLLEFVFCMPWVVAGRPMSCEVVPGRL